MTTETVESTFKLGDFGMAMEFGVKRPIHMKERVSVRWSPPELLDSKNSDLTITHKIDVWAFGVFLWEVFEDGKMPYGSLPNDDVLSFLRKGLRLETKLLPSGITELLTKW